MARKKKEPIVIQPTELIPTTIGVIQKKENGPWVVIIIVILFLLGIIFLDPITEFIRNPSLSSLISNEEDMPPSEPQTPSSPEEEPTLDLVYYEMKSDLTISLEGFLFDSFQVNEDTKELTFQINRTSDGKENFFQQHNYFVELYSSSKTLLQRIKIPSQTINHSKTMNFSIANAFKNGKVALITLVSKEESDYPQVDLTENNDETYSLTCQIDEKEFTYFFEENQKKYILIALQEDLNYLNTNPDYETVLDEYEGLVNDLRNQDGIEASFSLLRNGFAYSSYVDLKVVSKQVYQHHFSDSQYYPLNTEAKVIAFELESSGYSCK